MSEAVDHRFGSGWMFGVICTILATLMLIHFAIAPHMKDSAADVCQQMGYPSARYVAGHWQCYRVDETTWTPQGPAK